MLCRTLVGRQHELDQLMKLAGTTVVLGEAGIGKSRLVGEVIRAAQDRGMVTLIGRAVQGLQPMAYRPIAEAVASGCRRWGLPQSSELAPYRAALGRLIPEWRRADLSSSAESAVVLGEGVLRLLQTMGAGAGVLLVIEDLHWADPESLAVVEYLVDHANEVRLACVVTARPGRSAGLEVLDALVARRAAVRLELAPLPAGDVALMTRECLATTAAPKGLADLVARAEGVPFLIEELLAAAADAGVLVREGSGWAVHTGATRIVPRTLSDAIAQRIEALGYGGNMPRVAAMLGRRCDPRLVAMVLGETVEAVRETLDQCVNVQLMSVVDGTDYEFRHALTREAVLAQLRPSVQVRLAEQALAGVAEAHPGLPGSWCQVSAELSLLRGDSVGAARLLFTAGRRAVTNGALATAAGNLRRARDLVPAQCELSLDIDELRTEVAALAGDLESALAIGSTLATPAIESTRRSRVHLVLAHAACEAAQWATAEEHVRLAEPADEVTRVRSDALAARVELGLNRSEVAAATAQRALEAAERLGLEEPACQALEVLGRIARLEDLHAARSAFARQLEVANRGGLTLWMIRATHELGTVDLLATNDIGMLQRARKMAAEAGALATVASLDLQLAASGTMAFDVQGCLEATERCQQTARPLQLHEPVAVARMYESLAYAIAGNEAAMERAIAASEVGGVLPALRSGPWVSRAQFRLLAEDHDGALDAYDQALALERDVPNLGLGPHWGASVLLRSLRGAGRAERDELRVRSPTGTLLNEAFLWYADAVAAGQDGVPERAEALFAVARGKIQTGRGCAARRHLAERLVAECALANDWGQPVDWLTEAAAFFRASGHLHVARACRSLLRRAGAPRPRPERSGSQVPPALAALGVSDREADVCALIVEGLTSREIAARLYISARTVDKHVERLLAKTGVDRRSQLRRFCT